MKRRLLLPVTAVIMLLFAACLKKDDTPPFDVIGQYNTDSAKIVAYLNANNITNVKHDPGNIFYQIVNRGDTRDTANAAAYVTVAYTGTFLDKSQFDKSDSLDIGLNEVIPGWTIGVPKIGRGGEINLFLPSAFGYGRRGQGSVAPNTVLIFNIKLKKFTNR
ncbi:FKBP-type peptidyl-prolyl cis-trans isomerase [Chitinophaga sp. 212800010-3]|uniref:FKBP-type peptidyl-prolyl cis-trans isomerase n=1 Tax=unclassified Chitinophaga TaxID=2619133 RepID=UPI002DF0EBEF|nr:Peptidyl-prolyl cis-trans isomerase [Chitinophaga sp. 212800010-3]